jgi:hypothetical protein
LVTCAQCRKEITRAHPSYCHRCGYRLAGNALTQEVPLLPPRLFKTPPRAETATSASVEEMLAELPVESRSAIIRRFNPILQKLEADEVGSPTTPAPNNAFPEPKVSATSTPLASEDSDAEDGPSGGFIDLLAVDDLTDDERRESQARMAELSARYAKECWDNRRGIALGIAIGVAILGIAHSAGVHVGIIPFSRFGHHSILLVLPATVHGWAWEIVGTLLMACSCPLLWIQLNDPGEFSLATIKAIIAILPYLVGAFCLGIGR